MTVTTFYPNGNGTIGGGDATFANPTYAYDVGANNAGGALSANKTNDNYYTFDLSSITAGATINTVTVGFKPITVSLTGCTSKFCARKSGVDQGTPLTTFTAGSENTTSGGTFTQADLANLSVLVQVAVPNKGSGTLTFDYVFVTIDYTPAASGGYMTCNSRFWGRP